MRTQRLLTGVLALALVGCGAIQGNGNIVEQDRPLGAFAGVFLAEGLHGEVAVGPEKGVRVRGDSNLLDYIRLEVREGMLTSELDEGLSLLPSEPMVVTIVTPTLTEVRALNGTRMSVHGIDTEGFSVRAGGRSRVNVSGSAGKLTLVAAGDSEVEARALVVEEGSIDVSGHSDVRLHVTQEVSGTAAGASDILIQGNPPQRDIATSGGSQVRFE